MKNKYFITREFLTKHLFIGVLLLVFSCENKDFEFVEGTKKQDGATAVNHFGSNISIFEDVLEFENEESLSSLLDNTEDVDLEKLVKPLAKNGFISLHPMIDPSDEKAAEAYLAKKASKISKEGYLYSKNNGDDDIDLDDKLIHDPKFAKMLNEDRQIIVGKKFYVFTTNGLYFCHKKDRKVLKQYLKELAKSGKNISLAARACENMMKTGKGEGLNLSGPTAKITKIDDRISLYSACGGGGGTSGGGTSGVGGNGGGITGTSFKAPLLIPQNFGSCFHDENGIWQSLFGDTTKCNDYHDSTLRVQTKFWNQNYLIYASIGYRVKYQKKGLIGWRESETADYVEVGVNHIKYTYSYNTIPSFPSFATNTFYTQYDGRTYDALGNVTNYDIDFALKKWPFKNSKDALSVVTFTLYNNPNNLTLATYQDVNNTIKTLLKTAAKQIPKLAKDLEGNKVEVNIASSTPGKIEFITGNRFGRDKSNYGESLDFNFGLSFSEGNNSVVEFIARQLNGKKYEKVTLDMYGLAVRRGVTKGKKIYGQTK